MKGINFEEEEPHQEETTQKVARPCLKQPSRIVWMENATTYLTRHQPATRSTSVVFRRSLTAVRPELEANQHRGEEEANRSP